MNLHNVQHITHPGAFNWFLVFYTGYDDRTMLNLSTFFTITNIDRLLLFTDIQYAKSADIVPFYK